MRYHALAADYDGTIAHHGSVDEATLTALRRLKESGRRLILVTGRELDELIEVFPGIEVFDLVVAENGALLYWPKTKEERALATGPPASFVAELARRGVGRISTGRVIVATWEPHEQTVLRVIHEQALELQVIFNKGAVMVLPSGVNKATGLAEALKALGLSAHNVVAIGDAENDHALLAMCECGVAVDNALETVKARADWVTRGDHGRGVIELIEQLERDDLASIEPRLNRHHVLLGKEETGAEVRVAPHGHNILVAGTSGSGKSTLTAGFLERLHEAGYQVAILDPEGDYSGLEFAVEIGDTEHAPSVHGVIDLIDQTEAPCASVNMLAIPLASRPAFSDQLLPRLHQTRARFGRPHWILVDEAHHLLPSAWSPAEMSQPPAATEMLLVTVHPGSVSRAVLESVDLILAVGERPEETIEAFCKAAGRAAPVLEPAVLEHGEALAWWTNAAEMPPRRIRSKPPRALRQRHSRKYAEGNLGPDRSFYFRGPDGKLNLRAQNLALFCQLADGVDDATWLHHLKRNDYARWFREQIKDDELAKEAEEVALDTSLSATEGRGRIRDAIEQRYTLPAEPSSSVTDGTKFG
jgi:hydroxymethylpyrimidine pyrophosphatase-like HAD family hydrolase